MVSQDQVLYEQLSDTADIDVARSGSLFGSIRRFIWLILGISIIAGLIAAAVNSSKEPTYTASALLLVKPYSLSVLGYEPVSTDLTSATVVLETQSQLLKAPASIDRVAEALLNSGQITLDQIENANGPETASFALAASITQGLRVQQLTDADILQIVFSSANPDISAAVVNTVTDEFLKQQKSEKIQEIEQVKQRLEEQLPILAKDAEDSQRRVAERSDTLSPSVELRAALARARADLRTVLSDLPESGATTWETGKMETLRNSLRSVSGDLEIAVQQLENSRKTIDGFDAEFETLKRDAEAAQSIHGEMVRRLREISQLQAFVTADAQVISAATPPVKSSNLSSALVGILVGFAMLLLATLAAIIFDALHPRNPMREKQAE